MARFLPWFIYCFMLCLVNPLFAQIESAPPRSEGDGPYERLILRSGILIDGTGAPPVGPVDIVIENDRITSIQSVGYPSGTGDNLYNPNRPEEGDKEIDATGMYILPGFVDMHGHIGGTSQGTPAEYVFKLWMGHGITSVRDPGSGNGLSWTINHRERSATNEITAPRIFAYIRFGRGAQSPLITPEDARDWVRYVAEQGADGIKFGGAAPELLQAALDEAKKQDLGTAMHHAQTYVSRANVLHSATWGLTTMEHWYGLPEALFTDRTVQDFPLDYNYNNEQHRFGEAGRLWKQAAPPFSSHWNAVMDSLIELDFTIVPTLTIYEASRDLMRSMRAEWHDQYTLPSLWNFYTPSRRAHGFILVLLDNRA